MTSDLDLLMARIEEINAKEPPLAAADIAATIAYHRASRSRKASGSKPASTPKTVADLSAIMSSVIIKPKPAADSSFKFKVRL